MLSTESSTARLQDSSRIALSSVINLIRPKVGRRSDLVFVHTAASKPKC